MPTLAVTPQYFRSPLRANVKRPQICLLDMFSLRIDRLVMQMPSPIASLANGSTNCRPALSTTTPQIKHYACKQLRISERHAIPSRLSKPTQALAVISQANLPRADRYTYAANPDLSGLALPSLLFSHRRPARDFSHRSRRIASERLSYLS